ncbi:tetratricopeptide repeat protein [Simiduia litorea]|uniref:tetratricopeptide repeat-containing sulfotransferase family protein n=1 Tax=Simiduia litorea TaxID=1435348 RepID=UPI0036F22E76
MHAEQLQSQAYLYLQQGNYHAALASATQSLALSPDNPATLAAAAKALSLLQLPAESLPFYHKIFTLVGRATPVALYLEAAQAYTELRRLDKAQQLLEHAQKCFPKTIEPSIRLAALRLAQGDKTAAKKQFRKILETSPNNGSALLGLAQCDGIAQGSHFFESLRVSANNPKDRQQASYLYALAKIHRAADDAESFEATLAQALSLQARHSPPDIEVSYKLEHSRAMTLQTGFAYEAPEPVGNEPQIIFIVGMPRSGTSLVESLLSTHPDVAAGGELNYFRGSVATEYQNSTGYPLPQGLALHEHRIQLRNHYMRRVKAIAREQGYITDKTPGNYHLIGPLLNTFPGCKVIHLQRDPMDTCFSILQQPFIQSAPHTYNMDLLGQAYAHYVEIMSGWRSLAGDKYLTVDYECLVREPRQTFSSIFEFCGLSWKDRWLSSNRAAGATFTFSANQVHETISTRSIGSWQPYTDFLAPLRKSLTSHSVEWAA